MMCVPLILAHEGGVLMSALSLVGLGLRDVYDAWGELVNAVGGTLKALLVEARL